MQDYINSKRQSLKTIFALLLILFIAYLPVSTFLFFIKNDAFQGYFPPKFFMSESLSSGYLPLWNPYINFGIPQYGDMSSGYWSPVTWLIAATVGYNAYSFTLEVLLYLLIGAVGMYKLGGYFKLLNSVRFIAAMAFMCSGYNVGHLQHFNWISGAAFLPWCMWGYLVLNNKNSIKNILQCVLLFYLFIASAHPGLIIGSIYFFIALSLYIYFKEQPVASEKLKIFAITNVLFLVILMTSAAGMIIGYLDIIPHFSRAESIAVGDTQNPVTVPSWLSTLLPLSITKNDAMFDTDISMRNIYFSLTLLLFFIASFFNAKASQKFLLITGIAFALLSSEGIFKTIAYKLPLISYVRLNGEFIIFSILSFIIIGSIQLNRFISENKEFKGPVKWIYFIVELILSICIAIGLYKTITDKTGFLYSFDNINQQAGISEKIKYLIDEITFYDTLWLQGILHLFLLWSIKFCLREKKWKLLTKIITVEVIVATLLNLPFTGVGKTSVADVQAVLNKSPEGIVIPSLKPALPHDSLTTFETGLVGDWSMYNKQIGVTNEVAYPIMLTNTVKYFQFGDLKNSRENSFVFTFPTKSDIIIDKFSGKKIGVNLNSTDSGILVYQQAYFPHWFYYTNDERRPVSKFADQFISVPIKKGDKKVIIFFEPNKLLAGMLISVIVFAVIIILLIINPAFIRRSLFPS